MSEFWVLSEPETPDSERRLASWPSDEALEYQRVFCSVKPHAHLGVRDRITTPLSAVLANLEPYDFVWTWLGECLVQRHVLDVLRKHVFTGYEAIPAKVKFKSWSKAPPAVLGDRNPRLSSRSIARIRDSRPAKMSGLRPHRLLTRD